MVTTILAGAIVFTIFAACMFIFGIRDEGLYVTVAVITTICTARQLAAKWSK